MFGMYASNDLRALTNEQRKALAVCLQHQSRPPEILIPTKYVVVNPLGELELTAEAAQDWMKLVQQGFRIDEVTGEIVGASVVLNDSGKTPAGHPWHVQSVQDTVIGNTNGVFRNTPIPFTDAQEQRVRALIDEALADFAMRLRGALEDV